MEHEEMKARERLLNELFEIFDTLDTECKGQLNLQDFMRWTENPRFRAFFSRALGIDIFKAEMTFKLLDVDCSGVLDRDEFVVGCVRLKGGTNAIDAAVILRELKRVKRE